jgi:RNase P subunit RPR2
MRFVKNTGVLYAAAQKRLLCTKTYIPSLDLAKPPIQWITGSVCLVVLCQRCDFYHTFPSNARLRMSGFVLH